MGGRKGNALSAGSETIAHQGKDPNRGVLAALLLYRPLRAKGITLVCPSNAALQTVLGFNYWEAAARLLEEGKIAPQAMIDAEYPLANLQQAMEDLEVHPEWRRALVRVTG